MSLRVGLMNMMPDKALAVTERHFAGLLGADCGRALDLLCYSPPEIARGHEVSAHLTAHYRPLGGLPNDRLDLLVITGANVSNPCLAQEAFWPPLLAVLDWARRTGLPTLCSCLATHAVLEADHGQSRRPVSPKIWGVYDHEAAAPGHRLLSGLAARVPVPHSRHNEITADQFAAAGYEVLLIGGDCGVHLAVSRDGGRRLLLQGHPEYDAVSLLKEYKRELGRWDSGARADYPPLPTGCFDPPAAALLTARREAALAGDRAPLPETAVAATLRNRWRDDAVRVTDNWLRSLGT